MLDQTPLLKIDLIQIRPNKICTPTKHCALPTNWVLTGCLPNPPAPQRREYSVHYSAQINSWEGDSTTRYFYSLMFYGSEAVIWFVSTDRLSIFLTHLTSRRTVPLKKHLLSKLTGLRVVAGLNQLFSVLCMGPWTTMLAAFGNLVKMPRNEIVCRLCPVFLCVDIPLHSWLSGEIECSSFKTWQFQQAEVGNVTSKCNSVTCYRFCLAVRAITLKSNSG